MSIPDYASKIDAVVVELCPRSISRLREVGHAPYRCTRCFKMVKTNKAATDKVNLTTKKAAMTEPHAAKG